MIRGFCLVALLLALVSFGAGAACYQQTGDLTMTGVFLGLGGLAFVLQVAVGWLVSKLECLDVDY